jgi:hypothetical protein
LCLDEAFAAVQRLGDRQQIGLCAQSMGYRTEQMGSVCRLQARPRTVQCAPRCVYRSIDLGGPASGKAQKRFTGTWIPAFHLGKAE